MWTCGSDGGSSYLVLVNVLRDFHHGVPVFVDTAVDLHGLHKDGVGVSALAVDCVTLSVALPDVLLQLGELCGDVEPDIGSDIAQEWKTTFV